MQVLLKFFIGKKNGMIAGLLIMVMSLPWITGALAASPPSAPESLTAVPATEKSRLFGLNRKTAAAQPFRDIRFPWTAGRPGSM
jgi:hypothetical protein